MVAGSLPLPLSMPLAHLELDHADELVRRLEGAGLEPFIVDTDGLVTHFGLPLDQRSQAVDTFDPWAMLSQWTIRGSTAPAAAGSLRIGRTDTGGFVWPPTSGQPSMPKANVQPELKRRSISRLGEGSSGLIGKSEHPARNA